MKRVFRTKISIHPQFLFQLEHVILTKIMVNNIILTEWDVSFSENRTRSNFFIFQLKVSILFSILVTCKQAVFNKNNK